MLPDIDLDNEQFDDILENTRNLIAGIYPEWTDYNYHDPGITMLEMFAWLKESQQYYINKIGPENIKKYLKLLGIKRRPKAPCTADVSVTCETDLTAARGTKLYAGNICYEADARTYISSASIEICICDYGKELNAIGRKQLYFGGSLRILPFIRNDRGTFYIGFDKPLAEKELHHLLFVVSNEDNLSRNPITDPERFIPLVDMAVEYYDGRSWQPVTYQDETYGFLYTGKLSFRFDSPHAPFRAGGHEAYYIRFTLTGGQYDVLPVIKHIYFNLLPVTQRDTKAEYADHPPCDRVDLDTELGISGETKIFLKNSDGTYTPISRFYKQIDPQTGGLYCTVPGGAESAGVRVVNVLPNSGLDEVLGIGTGLPFQRYALNTDALEYESFTLMTELPDSDGKYIEWQKVSDFSSARSDDFVYVLDTQNGTVTFGDCIHGMAPEGAIRVIGYSLTLGAYGRVRGGKINEIGSISDDSITVKNCTASTGGRNEETIDDCLQRAHKLLTTTETIVTDEDCETWIARTQGLHIEKCKVIQNDHRNGLVTSVVVKPYARNGMGIPNERYIRNILASLEPRRMLGTQFRIVRPEYAAVSVYADVTVSKNYASPRETVQDAVKAFFDALRDEFGAQIIYSKLYELIDSLDCVLSVNILTMQIEGSDAERTREGDLLLARNIAAYLSVADIMLTV